ncbi:hypothetical protein [Azospirillum sp. SYSU D00513]|uniref:hypothetical protein n=1 Tax=Azospirillum sp. SYSU D00513 TaxID=2812561 RepID=UPI001A96BA32|nr:hypothetical protein [Azospirillum sp. SYSU D00513]
MTETPICLHCGKPVLPGEPRWAGDPQERPWHYGCAEAASLTWKPAGHLLFGGSRPDAEKGAEKAVDQETKAAG